MANVRKSAVALSFLTVLILLLCIYPIFAEAIHGDRNNNGIQDLTAYFNADFLSRIELDRDEDGKSDAWFYFLASAKEWDTRADYDEDHDGRVDEVHFIKNDEPIKTFLDEDYDGFLDMEISYQEGVPGVSKRLSTPVDPASIQVNF